MAALLYALHGLFDAPASARSMSVGMVRRQSDPRRQFNGLPRSLFEEGETWIGKSHCCSWQAPLVGGAGGRQDLCHRCLIRLGLPSRPRFRERRLSQLRPNDIQVLLATEAINWRQGRADVRA